MLLADGGEDIPQKGSTMWNCTWNIQSGVLLNSSIDKCIIFRAKKLDI